MDEVYTCLCGGQKFSIGTGFIRCSTCHREYRLKRNKHLDEEFERPEDFNARIRKENPMVHGELKKKE